MKRWKIIRLVGKCIAEPVVKTSCFYNPLPPPTHTHTPALNAFLSCQTCTRLQYCEQTCFCVANPANERETTDKYMPNTVSYQHRPWFSCMSVVTSTYCVIVLFFQKSSQPLQSRRPPKQARRPSAQHRRSPPGGGAPRRRVSYFVRPQ